MRIRLGRAGIPWAMAAGRAALGPVLVAAAVRGWNPAAMAGMVVAALLSDIFDGVLARRWRCDTAAVRVFDSAADTVFYLGVAAALWVRRPEVLRANRGLLLGIVGLEAVRYGFDLAKFGRMSSYHSYLAKAWGLTMATAVVGVLAAGKDGTGKDGLWLAVALTVGVLSNVEGLAMSFILPLWRHDVPTLAEAWRQRDGMMEPVQERSRSGKTLVYRNPA